MPPIWGLFNLYTMIKITLSSKPKPLTGKQFPKLMISMDGSRLIEVLDKPNEDGMAPIVDRVTGQFFPESKVIDGHRKYVDYNEPITIQNA